VDVTIPRNSLTVITGVSGSGKSSLAFDTIYAEGQRRYVESLSAFARQFLDQMSRPHVEHIEGLSPAISIEQKTGHGNPRSTVGTVTEIYDFLRLLFAYVGDAHCPLCNARMTRQSAEDILRQVEALGKGTRIHVLAPVVRGRKGDYGALLDAALREGYDRARINGDLRAIEPGMKLARTYKHDIALLVDRIIVGETDTARLDAAIRKALSKADGFVEIETVPDREGRFPKDIAWKGVRQFTEAVGCPEHGPQIVELSPRVFSFNSRYGACPACEGLGVKMEIALERLVPDESIAIEEGAVVPWAPYFKAAKRQGENPVTRRVRKVLKQLGISGTMPWGRIPEAKRHALLYGAPARAGEDAWPGLVARLQASIEWAEDEDEAPWSAQFLRERVCESCNGTRLQKASLAVSLGGKNIAEVSAEPLGALPEWLDGIRLNERQQQIARAPLKEVRDRVAFLNGVGLHYLSLGRAFSSLSGGEAQRVRLATQIGSQLTGVLYIMDEPSIGLHQRDNDRLIDSLKRLRDAGNTVIVVEHDEQTMRAADWVLDLGPGAGRLGGELVAAGTPDDIAATPRSLTGAYLRGEAQIRREGTRRKPTDRILRIEGCRHHNLRRIDAEFPLGLMIGVSGVSGAGKSSLVIETLLPALKNHCHSTRHDVGAHDRITGLEHVDKVVHVDQSPIGRTPRSNPATYTKLFDLIRDLYAATEESKLRGYTKGRFSFNVKGGRCEECEGAGARKIEMQFLPNSYVECEACKGTRYSAETLEVRYRGRSIAETLAMTIDEALAHFDGVATLTRPLATLRDVGLGYITLGQAATTLSGGEAQRMKLARELSRRNTGRTVYILDEPTTGLHFEDIRKLVEVLNRLVDTGSTVVVIEHNLDVLKCCDWVIDLGPEAGADGGTIIAQGPPETIAKAKGSWTGRYLKGALKGR
jgi:excinuclease ABC subunit A